ncbi:hypothetical protein ACI2UB_25415, partial [Ralstonia nicotianae]
GKTKTLTTLQRFMHGNALASGETAGNRITAILEPHAARAYPPSGAGYSRPAIKREAEMVLHHSPCKRRAHAK